VLVECKEALSELRLLCGGALEPGDVGERVSFGKGVEPCFEVLCVMSKT
jgi:hypothetical protein